MKNTKIKRIDSVLLGVLLYLSFCLSSFYFSRGNWSFLLSSLASGVQSSFIANNIFAFFYGGLFKFIIFQFVLAFLFKMSRLYYPESIDDIKYFLNIFYLIANLAVALFTLFYLISPIISIYGGVFAEFIITAAAMVFYLRFILKKYLPKENWANFIATYSGAFIMVYALITLLKIFGVL